MNYSTKSRKSTTWQVFFIAIVYICCVIKIWHTQQGEQELWANNLFYFLYAKDFIYKLIKSILLLINALSLILFAQRFSLVELRNYDSALIYLIFSFIFANTMTLWGMLTGVFILWGILPVLFGLNMENIHSQSFTYGLCCGILSLIYTPFLLLLTFIYIVIFRERLHSIRAFILPIIGASLAYGYLFAGFYLLDQTSRIQDFFEMITTQIHNTQFFTPIQWTPMLIFFLIVSVLLGCISFFQLWWKLRSINVIKRRKHVILLIITLLQFIFLLFFPTPHHYLLAQMMIILFTILLSLSLSHTKKAVVYKVVFFVLFALAVGSNL